VKKVLRFKYATWNIRGLGEKEGELDRILSENNIQISVITESKKTIQGTKETELYTVIYSGVDRHVRGQSGVMIWLHKSVSNNIDHYTFWKDRVIETRLK
jgi:exonuclease III